MKEMQNKLIRINSEKHYIEELIRRGDSDLSLTRRLEELEREKLKTEMEIEKYERNKI